jgi:hypothetical protein
MEPFPTLNQRDRWDEIEQIVPDDDASTGISASGSSQDTYARKQVLGASAPKRLATKPPQGDTQSSRSGLIYADIFADAYQDELFSLGRSIMDKINHLETTADHVESKRAIEASSPSGHHHLILEEPKSPPQYARQGVVAQRPSARETKEESIGTVHVSPDSSPCPSRSDPPTSSEEHQNFPPEAIYGPSIVSSLSSPTHESCNSNEAS